MCRGKSHPLVIVDDLNRPTPAARVMPFLLSQFHDAGIPSRDVRVLMATGTHRVASVEVAVKKIGGETAVSCQFIVHDCTKNSVKVGRTSFGTPVYVDREVVASDFVIGVGGIYPNLWGYGGGSKLSLGVLGMRSIMHLHYGHIRASPKEYMNEFRSDLDEIARMIGLNWMVSMQVDADREVVRVSCGDYHIYYEGAVAFSREAFRAPMPKDADVVISNSYPIDLSLTFVQSKGISPLRSCGSEASRIAVGSCSEGIGYHGLFPFPPTRLNRAQGTARYLSVMKHDEMLRRIFSHVKFKLKNKAGRHRGGAAPIQRKPLQLYRPGEHAEKFPSQISGFNITSSWSNIIDHIQNQPGNKSDLRVLIYPCAPLQDLENDPSDVEALQPTDVT